MKTHSSRVRAFSLIEIMVALAIGLILMSMALSYAPAWLVQRNIDLEDAELKKLETLFRLTLESTDYATTNVSATYDQVPNGVTPTAFSESTLAPATTLANHWFAKLANVQGTSVMVGTPPTKTSQPALASIVYNARGNPRYCFAAPPETDRQRFILCSIVGESALTLPPWEHSNAFFDSLWNTDFNTTANTLPSFWISQLTASQQAAWSGAQGGASHLPRVRVVRITIPKYRITVNNNHPTTNCWVYWNGDAGRMAVGANSGVSVSQPILEGRQIIVTFGTTESTAIEKYRINLRKNTSVTVE